jgi:hypothetical protein
MDSKQNSGKGFESAVCRNDGVGMTGFVEERFQP